LVDAIEQCCQMPRGRSEKRILGNRVLAEDRANQILSGFLLSAGLLLAQERFIRGFQCRLCIAFCSDAPLGKRNESTTDRDVTILRDAAQFRRERWRNRDALANRSLAGAGQLGSGCHNNLIILSLHHYGATCVQPHPAVSLPGVSPRCSRRV
jgi:hypothetical protein